MLHKTDLDSQLFAYESNVKSQNAGSRFTLGLRHWPVYAAAAGSALTLPPAAVASIIYSGPQNINVIATQYNSHTFTLNIDGKGNNFKLQGSFFVNYGSGFYEVLKFASVRRGVPSEQIVQSAGHAAQLLAGAPISGGANFGNNSRLAYFEANSTSSPTTNRRSHRSSGNWVPFAPPAYLGVEFLENGQPHYGWIGLQLQIIEGGAYQINLDGWAYNDVAGSPINAGQTSNSSTVPEPGSLSLALLAAGSAGVLAWRKRHNERSKVESGAKVTA